MIELKINSTKIRLDFSFFAVISLFLCFDVSGYGLMSIAACFLHESGHLIVMLFEKKKLDTLTFYGGGIKIGGNSTLNPSIKVVLAGSFTNFLVSLTAFIIADGNSIYPYVFAMLNFIVGVLNLLPLGYLDGKKLLEIYLIKKLYPEKVSQVIRIIETICFMVVVISVISLFFLRLINFTVAIMLIYLIIIDIFSKV